MDSLEHLSSLLRSSAAWLALAADALDAGEYDKAVQYSTLGDNYRISERVGTAVRRELTAQK